MQLVPEDIDISEVRNSNSLAKPRHAASSRAAPRVREDERRSKRQKMEFATFEQGLLSKVTLRETVWC